MFSYVSGGTGKNFDYSEFIRRDTSRPLDECIITCTYGETCGGPLLSTHFTTP